MAVSLCVLGLSNLDDGMASLDRIAVTYCAVNSATMHLATDR